MKLSKQIRMGVGILILSAIFNGSAEENVKSKNQISHTEPQIHTHADAEIPIPYTEPQISTHTSPKISMPHTEQFAVSYTEPGQTVGIPYIDPEIFIPHNNVCIGSPFDPDEDINYIAKTINGESDKNTRDAMLVAMVICNRVSMWNKFKMFQENIRKVCVTAEQFKGYRAENIPTPRDLIIARYIYDKWMEQDCEPFTYLKDDGTEEVFVFFGAGEYDEIDEHNEINRFRIGLDYEKKDFMPEVAGGKCDLVEQYYSEVQYKIDFEKEYWEKREKWGDDYFLTSIPPDIITTARR